MAIEKSTSINETLRGLSYTFVESIPPLERAFRIARLKLDNLRGSLGLQCTSMNYSDVRLLSAESYDKHVAHLGGEKLSDGLFHLATNLCFVRMRPEIFDNNYELVYAASVNTHEMTHRAMGDRLSKFPDWEEGLTEFITMGIMDRITPLLLTPSEQKYNQAQINACVPANIEGARLDARDFIVYMPGMGNMPYPRVKERRQVESLARLDPRGYKKFLKAAFGADSPQAERKVA